MFNLSETHMRDNIIITGRNADGSEMKFAMKGLLGKLGFKTSKIKYANMVMNAGIANIASLIIGDGTPATFSYVAVGSSNTAEAATQTALLGEITGSGMARVLADRSKTTTNISGDTAKLVASFTATEAVSISETGVFTAASAGIMLNRKVIATISLPAGSTINFEHSFQVSPV